MNDEKNKGVSIDEVEYWLRLGRRTVVRGHNVLVHKDDYELLGASGYCPCCSQAMDESGCRFHIAEDGTVGPFKWDDHDDLWVVWMECKNAARVPGLVRL